MQHEARCSPYLVVALREGALIQHLEAPGAVARGAVVAHAAEVVDLLGRVHHPAVQEEGDVVHVAHHSAVRQLQVIRRVPVAAAWGKATELQLGLRTSWGDGEKTQTRGNGQAGPV